MFLWVLKFLNFARVSSLIFLVKIGLVWGVLFALFRSSGRLVGGPSLQDTWHYLPYTR
jgi:hypothetical protein